MPQVAVGVHGDGSFHGLLHAAFRDAGQHKAALVQRLGALGGGADADGGEGMAHAQ